VHRAGESACEREAEPNPTPLHVARLKLAIEVEDHVERIRRNAGPVYVERGLARDEWVSFLAGNHTQSIRMRYVDFERLAEPTIDDYALAPSEAS
jgi:hypothetical protein